MTLRGACPGQGRGPRSGDPQWRLYEVVGSGATTRFLYAGDELVAEFDTSGNMLRRYVHGPAEDDPLNRTRPIALSSLSDSAKLNIIVNGFLAQASYALGLP